MVVRGSWAVLALAAASPAAGARGTASLVEVADISGLASSPDSRWVAYRIERPSIERNAIDRKRHV